MLDEFGAYMWLGKSANVVQSDISASAYKAANYGRNLLVMVFLWRGSVWSNIIAIFPAPRALVTAGACAPRTLQAVITRALASLGSMW